MPKQRCIAVSIISQWELKQFPEFPYPSSPQSCNPISKTTEDSSDVPNLTSVSASSSPASKADISRMLPVSCYIPSIPGIRFLLKYTIEPPYPDGQLFYFKLLMNGRHIASWGIDPRTMPRGQVSHALFETDAKQDSAENGRSILRSGSIESRPFIFGPMAVGTLAADDGGLIEVFAFRARARKRRALSLEQCRSQEQYGISLPNVGPLDKPQDTRFYDWILVDPTDQPYAALHFHYRSWEHLQALQLIPPSHSRLLLKPSNSFALITGLANLEAFCSEDEIESTESDIEDDYKIFCTQPEPSTATALKSCRLKVFDEKGVPIKMLQRTQALEIESTPQKEKPDQSDMPPSVISIPQATLDDWKYERPLPRLPKAKPSFEHFRNTSTSSKAPSVTSSLRSWLDRNSDNASPDPIIGLAEEVSVKTFSSSACGRPVIVEHRSSSWFRDKISPPPIPQKALPNPPCWSSRIVSPPSSKSKQNSRHKKSWSIPFRGRLIIQDPVSDDNHDNHQTSFVDDNSITPPEAEWLSGQRKPLSMKRGLDKIVASTKIRQLRKRREEHTQQMEADMSCKDDLNERRDVGYDADVDSCLDGHPTCSSQPNGGAASDLHNWI